ncbi:hypothetical protein GS399_19550 [Pedobacter sp. HMF7647]|uniref:Uncharacterized protein n=1 Tax=Hufsiella arboris TaxID=2695275 RepID=A0A7K1YEY7_9SPHI|nr:hypothetical protein [Hufsiella arboris]MXV53167.1 hypothetical protein [Hufsiella arboris]
MPVEKTIIFVCAMYCLALAIFHAMFWKLFKWEKDLASLTSANRAIIQILNCRLIYFFLFAAAICILYPVELYTTKLGKAFLSGMSIFWLGRTIEQFIFLRVNSKVVHLLTLVFFIGAVLFILPVFLSNT